MEEDISRKAARRNAAMPTCESVSSLVSEAHDRKLSAVERLEIRLHVAICRHCRSFQRQLEALRAAIWRDRSGDGGA